jgi:hypothetical protein
MNDSLVGLHSVQDNILVVIYDDGNKSVTLPDGRKLVVGLTDTDFDQHSNVDSTHPGLRPRWALVVSINERAKQLGITLGDKVLCEQLEWSRGFHFDMSGRRLWRISADKILAIDKDGLNDDEAETVGLWFAADERYQDKMFEVLDELQEQESA